MGRGRPADRDRLEPAAARYEQAERHLDEPAGKCGGRLLLEIAAFQPAIPSPGRVGGLSCAYLNSICGVSPGATCGTSIWILFGSSWLPVSSEASTIAGKAMTSDTITNCIKTNGTAPQ